MIRRFGTPGTEDIFHGKNTKAARKACPRDFWAALEALSGDRKDQYSIRINGQYRICFSWSESGPDSVEIVDYH